MHLSKVHDKPFGTDVIHTKEDTDLKIVVVRDYFTFERFGNPLSRKYIIELQDNCSPMGNFNFRRRARNSRQRVSCAQLRLFRSPTLFFQFLVLSLTAQSIWITRIGAKPTNGIPTLALTTQSLVNVMSFMSIFCTTLPTPPPNKEVWCACAS